MKEAISRLDLAGRVVNESLEDMLKQKFPIVTAYDREVVRNIKERVCKISINESQEAVPEIYRLPDGQEIEIGREQMLGPECLFNSLIIGRDGDSVQNVYVNSLAKVDQDIRKHLAKNTVLSGGSTLFWGDSFSKRLLSEVNELAPELGEAMEIKGRTSYRGMSSWIGASVLANLDSSWSLMISKEAYEEEGARILHSSRIN